MKICFTGDLFLGGDLKGANHKQIVRSKHYQNADIRIANLEQAVSNHSQREEKSTLYSGEEVLEIAHSLNLDAVALSNNHIHDKKEQGIIDTLNSLHEFGIPFFGAGTEIETASNPYYITNNLCVIGYCEYGKDYLSKVKVADEDSPGVNPLSYEKITKDLAALPDNTEVILHFHWGREHVSLPDHEHIALAEKLLEHENVYLIIGMHAHRAQGFIKRNKKRAYLSLGNFLFPNFYLEPRTHVAYPNPLPQIVKTTKDYHFVGELTYKKWRLFNRISLLVIFDTENHETQHVPVYQHRDQPVVEELSGLKKELVLTFITYCSIMYRLPYLIYEIIQKAYCWVKKIKRYSYIIYFLTRQNGLKWAFKKSLAYLRS